MGVQEEGSGLVWYLVLRDYGLPTSIVQATTDGAALWGIPLSTLTPAGLLAIIVILIATGGLVPRRTLNDIVHDRNEWRTAHRISEQARIELSGQVDELLEHARTTNDVLRSLPTSPPKTGAD